MHKIKILLSERADRENNGCIKIPFSLENKRFFLIMTVHCLRTFFPISALTRDSQFFCHGLETPRLSEPDSVLKLRLEKSRNRSRNRNLDIPSLGTGIKSQTFQVSESGPESKCSASRTFFINYNPFSIQKSPFYTTQALFK